MNKKIITLGVGVFIGMSIVGCDSKDIEENKTKEHSGENVSYQEMIINDARDGVLELFELYDGCIEAIYKEKDIDGEYKDDIRDSQKELRQLMRKLENEVNMNDIKDYYSDDKNTYDKLRNKYNQTNRGYKYAEIVTDITKDDAVTDDEAFEWICARELVVSDKPLEDDMMDSYDYSEILEEYGYSLIDIQDKFDSKYDVVDYK